MKPTPVLVLFFPVLLATPSAAQTDLRLIPQPREMRVEGSVSVPNGITVARPANAEDRFAALDLANALTERGIRVVTGETGPGPHIVLPAPMLLLPRASYGGSRSPSIRR
jgi:hypothetical protein